jgi:hypothetical protein
MDSLHICLSHIFSNVVDQMSQALNKKRSFRNIKGILVRTTFVMVVINSRNLALHFEFCFRREYFA